jgi:Thioredoxin-like [2Fe-2S] ferredoxin
MTSGASFHGASLIPCYEATVQATAEAVINALVANEEMIGIHGHRTPALPRDRVVQILQISFYALFKTEPAGRTVLRVCNGVPCYLHGAYELGLRLQELLGVGPGEPTPEGRLSWEWFACLRLMRACAHADRCLLEKSFIVWDHSERSHP